MKISKKRLLKVIKEEVTKKLQEETSSELEEVSKVLDQAKQVVEKAISTHPELKELSPINWKESTDGSNIKYGFTATNEKAETDETRYVFGIKLGGWVDKHGSMYDDSTVVETKFKFDLRSTNPKSLVFEDSTKFLTTLKEKMEGTGWMSISKDGFKNMPSWGTKGT